MMLYGLNVGDPKNIQKQFKGEQEIGWVVLLDQEVGPGQVAPAHTQVGNAPKEKNLSFPISLPRCKAEGEKVETEKLSTNKKEGTEGHFAEELAQALLQCQ